MKHEKKQAWRGVGEGEGRTVPALWKNAELAKSYMYQPHSSRFRASGSLGSFDGLDAIILKDLTTSLFFLDYFFLSHKKKTKNACLSPRRRVRLWRRREGAAMAPDRGDTRHTRARKRLYMSDTPCSQRVVSVLERLLCAVISLHVDFRIRINRGMMLYFSSVVLSGRFFFGSWQSESLETGAKVL